MAAADNRKKGVEKDMLLGRQLLSYARIDWAHRLVVGLCLSPAKIASGLSATQWAEDYFSSPHLKSDESRCEMRATDVKRETTVNCFWFC